MVINGIIMIYPFKIFNKNFNIKNIKKIFEDSIKNRPSLGVDGINIQSFEKKLDNELNLINRKVMDNTYNFSFYKVIPQVRSSPYIQPHPSKIPHP